MEWGAGRPLDWALVIFSPYPVCAFLCPGTAVSMSYFLIEVRVTDDRRNDPPGYRNVFFMGNVAVL